MKTDLDVSFGSLFGAANHLGISLCVRGWLAHGPGVGNRGADSDRATDRSTFVAGLIGRIRPTIAVNSQRWEGAVTRNTGHVWRLASDRWRLG